MFYPVFFYSMGFDTIGKKAELLINGHNALSVL